MAKNKEEKQMEGSAGLAMAKTEKEGSAEDEVLEPGTEGHARAAETAGPAAVFWETVADQPPLSPAMAAEQAEAMDHAYGPLEEA